MRHSAQDVLVASLGTLLEIHNIAFAPDLDPFSRECVGVPPSLQRFSSLRAVTISHWRHWGGPCLPVLPASVEQLTLDAGTRCVAYLPETRGQDHLSDSAEANHVGGP